MYNSQPKKNFDNGGALFTNNEKRGPTSPDYNGNIRINREMLDYLIDQMEAGQDLILTVFGYNRQGNRQRFIGLSPAIPIKRDERPARQVGVYSQGNSGRSYQRPQQQQTNNYREQSGGGYGGNGSSGQRTDFRPQRQPENASSMEEFQRGDRMPDFGGGDREGRLPWE